MTGTDKKYCVKYSANQIIQLEDHVLVFMNGNMFHNLKQVVFLTNPAFSLQHLHLSLDLPLSYILLIMIHL